MTDATKYCPTPAEFSTLYARAMRGESGAMDLRNNITLCGLDMGEPVLMNRNGDFARIKDASEGQLYLAVVVMLCAEDHGVPVRGELPAFDYRAGRFAA